MEKPDLLVIEDEDFRIGDVIQLEVSKKPHSDELLFKPNFEFWDNLFNYEESSVRFFVPNHYVELCVGEIWNARIKSIKILPGIKRTKDRRRIVNVFVDVSDRKEEKKVSVNMLGKTITVRTVSGSRILDKVVFGLNKTKKDYLCKDGNQQYVVESEVFMGNNGEIVGVVAGKYHRPGDYLETKRDILGRVAPHDLRPMLDRLPKINRCDFLSHY
ncbi:hypothetical protein KAI92_00960 [Candidatus Parcubacteria bacterium]|nr:hypothetical protein [Candidatus Parcubacteria bacterium]